MKDRWIKRRALHDALRAATGCGLQHTGWPCNTCFHALAVPMDDDALHRAWQATLVLRGDYKNGEYFAPFSDKELTDTVDALLKGLTDGRDAHRDDSPERLPRAGRAARTRVART